MSAARDAILRTLRGGLAGRPSGAAAGAGLKERRAAVLPPADVRAANDLAALFEERCSRAGCTVARAAAWEEVPSLVATYLAEAHAGPSAKRTPDRDLVRLDWASAGLAVEEGLPAPLDPQTVIGGCAVAVAETGSVVLSTGSANGPESAVLADRHVVVVRASRIAPTMEAAWEAIRSGGVPRSAVFATGPSRTGDIEMTIELGAHGARFTHVILVDGPEPT